MPRLTDNIKDRLSRYRQIKITVVGRKSGRTISIPVWCVLDNGKVYLLPVHGSDTQWYKNVLSAALRERGTASVQSICKPTLTKRASVSITVSTLTFSATHF